MYGISFDGLRFIFYVDTFYGFHVCKRPPSWLAASAAQTWAPSGQRTRRAAASAYQDLQRRLLVMLDVQLQLAVSSVQAVATAGAGMAHVPRPTWLFPTPVLQYLFSAAYRRHSPRDKRGEQEITRRGHSHTRHYAPAGISEPRQYTVLYSETESLVRYHLGPISASRGVA